MNAAATTTPNHTGGRAGRSNRDTGPTPTDDELAFPMAELLIRGNYLMMPIVSVQQRCDITADTHRYPLLAGVFASLRLPFMQNGGRPQSDDRNLRSTALFTHRWG
jgi:hypothetical protein